MKSSPGKAKVGFSRPMAPRLLFTGEFAGHLDVTNYDLSRDGQSFLMVNSGEGDRSVTRISVLMNWFDELRARVPSK
jgi:hypothetical protein